jgi:hypothetical protein
MTTTDALARVQAQHKTPDELAAEHKHRVARAATALIILLESFDPARDDIDISDAVETLADAIGAERCDNCRRVLGYDEGECPDGCPQRRICSSCSGSGEGSHDGSRCHSCRGSGEVAA